MILYLDTSAVVPLLIAEPGTARCRRLWEDADHRVTSRLTSVDTAAALSMAHRLARLSAQDAELAWSNFVASWPELDLIEVTADLSDIAAGFTRTLALRGYDAVHCASAAAINDPSLGGRRRRPTAPRSLAVRWPRGQRHQ